MKKTVKSLIIAASVAAIAGIGAVSFAAWNAGSVTPAKEGGSTATIVTKAGEIKVTGNNLSDSVKLVPYDQVAQFDNTKMAKMQTFTVSYDAGTDGADVESYNYSMELTTNAAHLVLYYKLGDLGENYTPTDPTAEDSGWALLETSKTEDETTTYEAVKVDLNDLYDDDVVVNIVMVSNDYTAHGNGKTYELTISAEAK